MVPLLEKKAITKGTPKIGGQISRIKARLSVESPKKDFSKKKNHFLIK